MSTIKENVFFVLNMSLKCSAVMQFAMQKQMVAAVPLDSFPTEF